MKVSLRKESFDPWRELADYRDANPSPGGCGATSVFVGTMRGGDAPGEAREMFLEHYPGMTEKCMRASAARALEEGDISDVMVIHRIGDVSPGDAIVLVAAWGGHRGDAYRASRQILEDLKSTVPFWKKERFSERAEWVKENTPA